MKKISKLSDQMNIEFKKKSIISIAFVQVNYYYFLLMKITVEVMRPPQVSILFKKKY